MGYGKCDGSGCDSATLQLHKSYLQPLRIAFIYFSISDSFPYQTVAFIYLSLRQLDLFITDEQIVFLNTNKGT